MLWIHIEVTDFSILLIFKHKQYKNANVANFVYYGKLDLVIKWAVITSLSYSHACQFLFVCAEEQAPIRFDDHWYNLKDNNFN